MLPLGSPILAQCVCSRAGSAGLGLHFLPTPGSQEEVTMLGPEDMVPPSYLAYQHRVLSETPDSRLFFSVCNPGWLGTGWPRTHRDLFASGSERWD